MLVLGRHKSQVIRMTVKPCDTEQIIDVLICDVRGSKVQVGIEANENVRIVRGEVEDQGETK